MFKNEFQGGSYVEVFTAQGKDPLSGWKTSSSAGVKKIFEKDVKSFIYVLEGSPANTKIQLPKDSRYSLSLIQRYLVLQVCVPKGSDFSIDLGVQDSDNSKRRLFFSTAHKETHSNPLHSKIPLGLIRRCKWLNLCIDLLGFVSETWKGQTFKSLESICISANVRLRRIFTMKIQPMDTTDDEDLYGFSGINSVETEAVPRQQQLAPDVPQETQVINPTKVRHYEGKGQSQGSACHNTSQAAVKGDVDLNSSGGLSKKAGEGYHIAFGTKVTGQRKGSGKESNRTIRSSQARSRSDADVSHTARGSSTPRRETASAGSTGRTGHQRKNSDPGTNLEDPELTVDKESLRTSKTWTDGADGKEEIPFVRPHPPREPSADKVRRKPRVKSAGKERTPHTGFTKDESSSMPASVSSSSSSNQALAAAAPSVVADEEEVSRILQKMSATTRQGPSCSNSESDLSSHNTSGVPDGEDSISEVIQVLRHNHPRRPPPRPGEYEDTDQEYDSDDDDDDVENKIYTFSSPPKSARHGQHPDRLKNKKNSHKSKKGHRTRRKSDELERPECRPSGTQGYYSSEEDEGVSVSHRGSRHPGSKHSHQRSHPRVPKASQEGHLSNGLLNALPSYGRENGISQTPGTSQTRMSINRKSLREIPKDDVRLSQTQKPYNHTKYQMEDLTESFEQQMLLSLKRQQDEDLADSDCQNSTAAPVPGGNNLNKLHYADDSLTDSSDESSMGTLRHRKIGQGHNYQEEMRQASAKMTNEFLSQSNPRDWGKVFSPPIVLPSDLQQAAAPLAVPRHDGKNSSEARGSNSRERQGQGGETDEEEELDLLFDPVLNCYFDPRTCKYYELV